MLAKTQPQKDSIVISYCFGKRVFRGEGEDERVYG